VSSGSGPKQPWSRSDRLQFWSVFIGVIGVLVALGAAIVSVTVPEVRCFVGLDKNCGSSMASNTASDIVGFSGGCPTFRVYAQNRWAPYGAVGRQSPNVLSQQVVTFAPNLVIAVDGWVHGRTAYPTNTPPWNSDIWFHTVNGQGWVSFAGVRANPTSQDPTGLADGGPPAPTSAACEGATQ
jgi:hypothetical protein